MANEIQIVVTSADKTGSGFDATDKKVKQVTDSVKGIGDQSAKTEAKVKSSSDGMSSSLKRIGETAAGVLAADFLKEGAAKVKEFMSSTVEAASSLGESTNAVNQVFGQSSKVILDWGKNNATQFGLSQRAFNEAVTPMGALLKNTGLDMKTVSADTLMLTQRAADMASVFNTSVPDALESIQAGLRGESDPLEKYGVSLSAAAVQTEALAETSKTSANALTTQELASARLNLIMKQTSATAGDFKNTSNGLANAQRISAAEMENAKAKIGTGLLPVLAELAKITGLLATAFAAIPRPIEGLIVAVLGLAAAALLLAPRITAAREAFSGLSTGALAADTRLGKLARTAGIVAVAMVAVQTASAALGHTDSTGVATTQKALEALGTSGQNVSEVTKHLNYDLGTLGSGGMAKTGNAIAGVAEGLTGLGSVFDESLEHARERISSIDAALADEVSNGNIKEAAGQFDELTRAAQRQGISVEDLKKGLPQYQNALDSLAKTTGTAGAATAKAADDLDALSKKLGDTSKSADTLAGEMSDKLFNSMMDSDHALLGVAESLTKVSDSFKQNGKQLDIHTEKGQANREAILAQVDANIKAYDVAIASGAGADVAAKAYDANTQALERQMRQAGLTQAQIDGLVGKYATVPDKVNTNIATQGLTDAINNLNDLLRLLNGLPPLKKVTVQVDTFVTGSGRNYVENQGSGIVQGRGNIRAQASGGPGGGMTLIGEHGPELVNLPDGSMVYPSGQSQAMMSAVPNVAPVMINGGGTEVRFTGDTDGAVSVMFMRLIRERKIILNN